MDLNINELPETNDSRLKPEAFDKAVQPAPRDGTVLIKAAGFLAVVVVLTALAINSHQGSTPATMASDTPPTTPGASTLPSVTAPTDRATTGSGASSPAATPAAPSPPLVPNAAGTTR